jgi:hypothetical protein
MTEYIYTAHMSNGDKLEIRSELDYGGLIGRLGALRYNGSSDSIRENPFAPNIDMELGSVVDQEVDYDKMQIVNIDQICYLTIKKI